MLLHHKAILVDLDLRSIPTTKIDRTTTREVLRIHNADEDAGRWTNTLWPKEALAPISSYDSVTGRIHRDMTLPWIDNGNRILPTAKHPEYMKIMRSRKAERQALVDDFIANYPAWLAKAAAKRTTLFDPSDYLCAATAAARFAFTLAVEPVPHRDDFRISVDAAEMEEMQALLDHRLKEAAKVAQNDLLARIAKPLEAIVTTLSNPDSKFRDTILKNILSVAAEIPDFNITEDPHIEEIRVRILNTLGHTQPADLRDSASSRSRIATQANDILSSLAPWLTEEAA